MASPISHWPLLGDPDGEWDRWFALVDDTPPARYVAMLNDSEAHHRAALDGIGVALGRVTRARLLLDSGQLIALSPHRGLTRERGRGLVVAMDDRAMSAHAGVGQ